MSRRRSTFVTGAILLAPAFLFVLHAQQAAPKAPAAAPKAAAPSQKSTEPMKAGGMTKAQKIADAMSAAPAAISKGATIMDWPEDMAKGKPTQLRAGTNGWVCYPTMQMPGMANVDSPMCIDKQWQGWAEGYMSKQPPKVTGSGVAYMLKGDGGASNTDPFAEGPTPSNAWVVSPPHVMLLYADPKMLDAYPTDPNNGGPWVMWKGTPYAHVMVPVSATKMATMPK